MDLKLAVQPITVTAEALTWLAVHGNVCLAMRHPDNHSPNVRPRMVKFLKEISNRLVDSGFISREAMDGATKYELQQGNDITR